MPDEACLEPGSRRSELRGARRAAVLLLMGLALLTAGGCGNGETGRWAGTVDTLSGGTVRIQNPAEGTWTAETRPRPELDLIIGRATGAESYLFGDVRDLTVDAMGRIWVLDNQSRQLRVFGSDGGHVRSVGGPGEGPGEFMDPNGLARDSTTGRLWVVDPGTNRYTAFDTAGRLLETRQRGEVGYGYVWPGHFDRAGRLFDYMLLRLGTPNAFAGFVVRDDAWQAVDSLRFPSTSRERSFFRIERTNGMTMRPVPFTPYGDWNVSPDGTVWVTEADPYRLIELDPGGDTVRIVERRHEPVAVTAGELDSIRNFYEEEYGQGANQVDFSRIPDEKAAIRALFVARDGDVWVLPYGRQGETGRIADVFGSEGRYRGRLRLPVRLRWSVPPVIVEDALYGVREEPATGVDQIVRVELVR